MNLNDLFGLLNLDKDSKQKIVDSHPLLKKYFSGDVLKRKPKKLDSPLAKRLENPKHRLTEQYYSLRDIYKILEIVEFDDLRKQNYLAAYEKISKIDDLADYNHQLSQLYAQIKQDLKYFIKKEESPVENLPLEDQIQLKMLLGSKEFKK